MLIWEAMAESRMTATRLTLGAMSLSSSSHFPLKPNSDDKNPVALPPGRAKLQKAAADWIDDIHEYDRNASGDLLQSADGRGALRQHCVRCERDQISGDSAMAVDIARTPSVVDAHVAADDPA
jgi:hypothetical protein